MNGPHFKEVLETVCMTTGSTKNKIRNLLGISQYALWCWQNKGVPNAIKPYVMSVLRSVMLEENGRVKECSNI